MEGSAVRSFLVTRIRESPGGGTVADSGPDIDDYRRVVEDLLISGAEERLVDLFVTDSRGEGYMYPHAMAITTNRLVFCHLLVNRDRLMKSMLDSVLLSEVHSVRLDRRYDYDRSGASKLATCHLIVRSYDKSWTLDFAPDEAMARKAHDWLLYCRMTA